MPQFLVHKPYGSTPKEMLDIVTKETGCKKCAFGGRLDPMACGLMKVFTDDDCRLANQANDEGKRYRFQFIAGIKTTSLDLLGFITEYKPKVEIVPEKLEKYLQSIQHPNRYIQKVPIHSSYPVRGKDGKKYPLWWWAKEGKINEVEIPSFPKKLFKFNIIQNITRSYQVIATLAKERIELIDKKHNFSQLDILESWGQEREPNNFQVFELEVDVSSGFYVRQLVDDIGAHFNIPTATLEIERLAYF